MQTETSFQLLLIAWFFVLAVGEVICGGTRQSPEHSSDQRLIANFALTLIGFIAGGLVPLAKLSSAMAAQHGGIGLANQLHVSWSAMLAFTFILDSLATYWVHRLMHVVPILWRVHRIHHADRAVDVSTSFRNHPLELGVIVPVSAAVVLVLGTPPSVLVVTQSVFMAAAMWQHADIRLSHGLDKKLAWIIITPRLHRFHHSPDRNFHDSNFGDSLILWDRLFGTLTNRPVCGEVGLDEQRVRPDYLVDQIWWPLRG